MTIKAEYLSFGGDKMSNFFALLLVISFFALPYYGIKRYLTKKKNPEVYAKIKKRIWYALIIFVISFIGVGATQPAAAKTKAPQHDKVSTVDNKLTAAKSAVNALFTNSKHTKLKQDVTKHDITAADKQVKQLKSSKTKKQLQTSIAIASDLLKKAEKEAALATSKSESARAASKSESKAQKESEEHAEKESSEKLAASISNSESVSSVQAASTSARQASEQAASSAASESIRIANEQAARAASESTERAATVAAQSTQATVADTTTNQGVIVGNTRSHIYHVPGQATYHMSSANMITFPNEQAAIAAGYRKSER